MKQPVLLTYNLHGDKSSQIKLLCMKLMIRLRPVKPEEYGQTLIVLCGAAPSADIASPADVPTFEDEMLVLANFTSAQISEFLAGFRAAKIAPVALKAVLTETNQHWNAATLHQQLVEEHEALSKGMPPAHDQT